MCALLVFKDYMEKNLTLTVILIIVDAVLIAFSFVMYAIRNTRELHNLPEEEKIGFYKGMVIRYICRSSYKEHLYDDLLKAKYYLDRLINILQKEEKEDGVQG